MTQEEQELIEAKLAERNRGLQLLTDLVSDDKTATPNNKQMEKAIYDDEVRCMMEAAIGRIIERNLPLSLMLTEAFNDLLNTGYVIGWQTKSKYIECEYLEKLMKEA